MSIQNIMWVFLGGGAGSVLRFLISWIVKTQATLTLPFATLSANVLSVIVYAIVFLSVQQKDNPDTMKFLLLTGFCGGLSTFSTFSFETFELFKRGETVWAAINIIANCLLCIGLFFLLVRKVVV
jgi:fluoride exporter